MPRHNSQAEWLPESLRLPTNWTLLYVARRNTCGRLAPPGGRGGEWWAPHQHWSVSHVRRRRAGNVGERPSTGARRRPAAGGGR
uniref:Uncharacterized protein n=1 Tax=Oryza brachyantha TaxID=4533 RepID=J3LLX3_ORYBR